MHTAFIQPGVGGCYRNAQSDSAFIPSIEHVKSMKPLS
jgi:hypothetical protein